MVEIFGHVFKTNNSQYFYDVHQNEIIQVDPVLAAVLPLYGVVSTEDLEDRLAEEYGRDSVREAFCAIETGRNEDGLFLADRPELVSAAKVQKEEIPDIDLGHLVLTVTEQCNLRCRYCMHGADLPWIRKHGTAGMSEDAALAALDYFLTRCIREEAPGISFYGGEALKELGLIERVITKAREHPEGKSAIISIDTNGVLLNGKVADLVARENLFLQISLDGPKEIHDRNRRSICDEGSFDKIMEGLDAILIRDPDAYERLTFVSTLAPPVDLDAIAEFFQHFPPFIKHGIDAKPCLRVNIANLSGQDWPNLKEGQAGLRIQIEEARRNYLNAVDRCAREELSPVIRALFEPDLFRLYSRNRSPMPRKFVPGGNCKPGRRKLHVMPDGSFHPCERTGNAMSIGDLSRGIQSKRIQEIRDGFHQAVQDKCGKCWALRVCGACFAVQAEYADQESGAFPFPEKICKAIRDSRESSLSLLAEIVK